MERRGPWSTKILLFSLLCVVPCAGCASDVTCKTENNGEVTIRVEGGNGSSEETVIRDYISAELSPWTLKTSGSVDDQWWMDVYASDYSGTDPERTISMRLVGPPTGGRVYATAGGIDTVVVNGDRLLSSDARVGQGDLSFQESIGGEEPFEWETTLGGDDAVTIESSSRETGGFRDVEFGIEAVLAPRTATGADGDLTLTATGTISEVCEKASEAE
jgi:hypothetical protein